jgi:adenine-specific DNA-methyltransferase
LSRVSDLIAQVKSRFPEIGADLDREFKVLSARRAFGLNFERHLPENVELLRRPREMALRIYFDPLSTSEQPAA